MDFGLTKKQDEDRITPKQQETKDNDKDQIPSEKNKEKDRIPPKRKKNRNKEYLKNCMQKFAPLTISIK